MARTRSDDRMQQLVRTIDIKWEKWPTARSILGRFQSFAISSRSNSIRALRFLSARTDQGNPRCSKESPKRSASTPKAAAEITTSRRHCIARPSPTSFALCAARDALKRPKFSPSPAESFYNVSTAYEEMPPDVPEPFRDIHLSSHGEGSQNRDGTIRTRRPLPSRRT